MTPLEQMTALVRASFPCGTPGCTCSEEIAREWIALKFPYAEAERWLKSRCFEPQTAAAFKQAGFSAEDVSRKWNNDTVGYAAASQKNNLPEALAFLRGLTK